MSAQPIPQPEIRVQDEQGNIHVFPGEATPEMIAGALNVKPPAPEQPPQPEPNVMNTPMWSRGGQVDQTLGRELSAVPGGVMQGILGLAQMNPVSNTYEAIRNAIRHYQGQPAEGLQGALDTAKNFYTGNAPDKSGQILENAPEALGNSGGQAIGASALPFFLKGAGQVADALPSKARASANFQEVSAVTKNQPLPVTNELSGALSRYQELADRGGQQSLAVRKLLNRVTDPDQAPITYGEARDFYSNISRLSADEFGRLTPVMKQQIGSIRVALNNALQQTASDAGKGAQYSGAMKEYAQSARLQETGKSVLQFLLDKLPYAATAYAANKAIRGK